MLGALYYPHTEIKNPNLIKTALLLWDYIECIVPHNDYQFRGDYRPKLLNEAFELIARKHVPTLEEKNKVHNDVKQLISETSETLLRSYLCSISDSRYLIYPDKFIEQTWDFLENKGFAYWDDPYNDYSVPPALGLLMMSSLADICAGTQKQKITDRTQAYSLLERKLALEIGAPYVEGLNSSLISPELDKLVTISMNVIGAENIPLKALVKFRKKEIKENSNDYRTLRLNYMNALTRYLDRISKECKTRSDIVEVERQFKEEINTDLNNLKHELGLANKEALFSKEMAVSLLFMAGSLVKLTSELTHFSTDLKVMGIIPLIRTRIKLKEARRKAFLNNKISWLYLADQKFISIR